MDATDVDTTDVNATDVDATDRTQLPGLESRILYSLSDPTDP